MRQRLIWFAIIAGAAFYIFAFFVDETTVVGQALHLTATRTVLSDAISILTTMAIGLGVINLFHVHGRNILQRRKDWGFSIIVFGTFFMVVAFMVKDIDDAHLPERSFCACSADPAIRTDVDAALHLGRGRPAPGARVSLDAAARRAVHAADGAEAVLG